MRERPILFSGAMVRAIIEGRKTQTRRVMKPLPINAALIGNGIALIGVMATQGIGDEIRCPYGFPGDRLWVRETWGVGTRPDPNEGWRDGIEYRADESYLSGSDLLPLRTVSTPAGITLDQYKAGWHPSIHIPRWASRINLEITDVRVRRVAEISEEDARAEGAEPNEYANLRPDGELRDGPSVAYRAGFHDLWDSINAKRGFGWATNPWCWCLTFKRVDP